MVISSFYLISLLFFSLLGASLNLAIWHLSGALCDPVCKWLRMGGGSGEYVWARARVCMLGGGCREEGKEEERWRNGNGAGGGKEGGGGMGEWGDGYGLGQGEKSIKNNSHV